jgi:hypothetical protein
MHTIYINFLAFIFLSTAIPVMAESFPVTARLFIGQTGISPDNLNTEMTAQSIKNFKDVNQMGIEATYSQFKHFEFGFRYTKHYAKNEEEPANPATDFYGTLNQDSVMFVVRIPFVKTNFFRADVFGGVGGSNTTFTIKTAGQDGELSRKKGNDWFATPYTAVGGSFAVGFKKFYLVAEGGIENNKIKDFDRTGNVNANITNIDLSGSYFTIGLLFDGVSATKK